jgi:pilus assembly protein Flp/PilA
MKQLLKRLMSEDSGQDMIEYALVAAIVALGTAAVVRNFSNTLHNTFNGIGNALTSAVA